MLVKIIIRGDKNYGYDCEKKICYEYTRIKINRRCLPEDVLDEFVRECQNDILKIDKKVNGGNLLEKGIIRDDKIYVYYCEKKVFYEYTRRKINKRCLPEDVLDEFVRECQ